MVNRPRSDAAPAATLPGYVLATTTGIVRDGSTSSLGRPDELAPRKRSVAEQERINRGLREHARRSRPDGVREMLNAGGQPSDRARNPLQMLLRLGGSGPTALHVLAQRGSLDTAKALVTDARAKGHLVDPNRRAWVGSDKTTPLGQAVKSGNADVFEVMVGLPDADVTTPNNTFPVGRLRMMGVTTKSVETMVDEFTRTRPPSDRLARRFNDALEAQRRAQRPAPGERNARATPQAGPPEETAT